MKNNDYNELPEINARIKSIIDEKFNGNVSKFSQTIGYRHSSKVNRLFNVSARNGQYPEPTVDLIINISERLGYTTDYLLKGKEAKRNVNNIEIDNSKRISGNDNVMGDNNTHNESNENSMMKDMVLMLQEQNKSLQKHIDELTEMLKNNAKNKKDEP